VRKFFVWLALFILIWAAWTVQTLNDKTYDADLGISPNRLSFDGAAEWALPLGFFTWLSVLLSVKLMTWIVRRVRRKAENS